ncbi:hypothetical protein [Thermococcus paralvinellae]|uniref:Uncharacterized protein n=1 Tax=Thermococcus paralvinellae TaxID=582419 RepID=W0I126_9EURY|nr:hypothetical protein [Thermococcus paralvinellae]AHF79714.1 Hypothetical protein TES1_0320 [Thermococcus paralvinellae]
MAYIGFARTHFGPYETYEKILEELRKRGFNISFSKHHWMGDAPFGLIIADSDKGKIAVRWALGDRFELKLEEVSDEDWDEFIEDTLEYLSGD